MRLDVLNVEGNKTGTIELPPQFREIYEPDIIKRAVIAIESHNRKQYGSMPKAGQGVSAKLSRRRRDYKGAYGKGISRAPRKTMWRRGMQFGWVGALAPGTRGGRRSHPPKATKIWGQKINKKERRKALRSALSGIAMNNRMTVIENKLEDIKKTKELKKILEKIGIGTESIKRNKSGKAKSRGRGRYRYKKNALIIVSKECNLVKAAKNMPGFDITNVKNLNVKLLTLGHNNLRNCLWTKEAIEIIGREELFTGGKNNE